MPFCPVKHEVPLLRDLGRVDYQPTWKQMQEFTRKRDASTRDEIWFLEHPPVFTMGLNASDEHLLAPGEIPVVKIDRGGQVTYHGPGQLVVYPLLDLRRLELGVRALVTALEQAVVDTLAGFDISASARADAPGVYTDNNAKIASIGLRVRRNCSYHGLAFNVAMDLAPFQRINPCGFAGLAVTQVSELGGPAELPLVRDALAPRLVQRLGYNNRPDLDFVTDEIAYS